MRKTARVLGLACAWLAAVMVVPSWAGSFSESDLPTLQARLANARYARVDWGGRSVTVDMPRVEPGGLAFRKQSALFTVGDPERGSPPNPIPWSQLSRIEAGVVSRHRTAFVGAAVGAGLGAVLCYTFAKSALRETSPSVPGWTIGGAAVFGLLGGAVGAAFTTVTWHEVEPGPGPAESR